MAISSVSGNNNAYSMQLLLDKQEKSTTADQAATGTASYTSSLSTNLRKAIELARESLGLDAGDRITFDTIAKARVKLEEEFQAQVKADLTKLGVDEDVVFKLYMDDKGAVKVECADAEQKKKIEQYLKDNTKIADKFKEIQTLADIENTRTNPTYSPQAVRSRIQTEAMTTWFTNLGQSSSSTADYFSSKSALNAQLMNAKV